MQEANYNTWKRNINKDLEKINKTWEEAKPLDKNKQQINMKRYNKRNRNK